MHAALDAGINIFDVAPYYGLTAAETVLGKALRGIDRARYILATRLALQFAVATSPCVTTVVGGASASHIERDVAWIGEPIDVGMLAEVEAILAPVRGIGWASGRPENQNPAPLPRRRRSWTVMCT